VIIVDTSIIVAFVNAGDDHHDAVTDGSTLPTTTSRPP
jgi:predicted nucleic acid-binding protein